MFTTREKIMSPADHLIEARRLIDKLRAASANPNPLVDLVSDCLEHLAATCEASLVQEQADAKGKAVKFREFL